MNIKKMQGSIPPMITPFTRDGEIDVVMLEKLVDYLKDHVHGLFVCGSYGSGPMMSIDERKKVVEICLKVVNGKIPIIAHTGTTNTRDTIELTRHAENSGCWGASAVAPFYFHHTDSAVVGFYTAMRNAVSKDFPLFVYNNPRFSGYSVSMSVMKKLAEAGISGVKDATFDIMTYATYQRELGHLGFDVVLGTEAMWLSARALGCEAYIPGLANAFPELCKRMWEEGMRNDFGSCKETQFLINKLRDVMYLASSTQLAIYAMLSIRKIITAFPRLPFVPPSMDDIEKMEKALASLEVI